MEESRKEGKGKGKKGGGKPTVASQKKNLLQQGQRGGHEEGVPTQARKKVPIFSKR